MTKILIATPAYGEMFYTPYVSSVIRLQKLMARNKWDSTFASIAYADIVECRNFLLTHFYDKTDATHLLFIDADMGYDPKLVADMVGLRKPVVGVIAPRRQIDLNRLADLAAKGEKAESAIARSHDFLVRPVKRTGKPRIVNGFMEVEGCGAGIMLIERGCVKTMLAKLPKLSDTAAKKSSPLAKNLDRLIRAFEPITVDGGRLSEDYSFCHRWRNDCGGEVWANIAHQIVHVGLHRFAGRYQDAMPRGPRIMVGNVPGKPAAAAASKGSSKPVALGTSKITVKEGALRPAAKAAPVPAAKAALVPAAKAAPAPAPAPAAKAGNGAQPKTGLRRLFSRSDEKTSKN
jgi:hypothetical protein